MAGVVIIGAVLGILALFTYWFFKLGENTGDEHIILQLLLMGLFIAGLSVLGGAVINAANCVDYYNGSELTVVCLDEPTGTSETFMEFVNWTVRLMQLYLVIYIVYRVLLYWGKLPKFLSRRRK